MARRNDSGEGSGATVFYAPDGSEYPINGEPTAVELVELRSRGYRTEKPAAEEAAANQVPIPDAGPTSGAIQPRPES